VIDGLSSTLLAILKVVNPGHGAAARISDSSSMNRRARFQYAYGMYHISKVHRGAEDE
jgi:hypothetical protein